MKTTIIIPARYASQRFHGKMLKEVGGKPLIQQTAAAAKATGLRVIVATDDSRIATCVEQIGVETVQTGPCSNGTERCAEAARKLGLTGIVINWQGDSPCIPQHWVGELIDALEQNPVTKVATPVQLCTTKQANELRTDFLTGQPGGTFAVCDDKFRALYFSKCPVPHKGPFLMHIGMYAYTCGALADYGQTPSILENSEKLEQLRFLEKGWPIQCVPVDGDPVWEVNNPADVRIVERMLAGDLGTLR
jgi:3-deoxy-manno-octulosonate cytidylyltransferase (CMP-KDO synthetase)